MADQFPVVSTRESQGESGEIPMPSFRDVLRVLFRQRWLIAGAFFMIAAAGTTFSLLSPNIYESEGSLLLKAEIGDLSIDPAGRGGIVTAAPSRSDPLNEISILKSQMLAEEVASAVGPDRIFVYESKLRSDSPAGEPIKWDQKDIKSAAGSILKDLEAGSNESAVLWVKYRHPDRHVASAVVQSLMDLYIERHNQVHRSGTSPEMIQSLADNVAKEIADKEAEIKKYEDEHGGGSLTDQKTTLMSAVRATEDELARVSVQKNASQAGIDEMSKMMTGKSADGGIDALPAEVANPAYARLEEALSEAELRRAQAETRYADESKEMKIALGEIAKIKEMMAGVPQTIPRARVAGTLSGMGADPASVLDAERVNFKRLESTERQLQERLASAKDELRKIEALEEPVLKMDTELKGLQDNYAKLVSSVRDAQIATELDKSASVSNVKIVQAATQPDKPVAPRRGRNIALTLFAGLIIGVGLGFVREFFDDTVKSREDMEKKLGLTVLAVVPAEEFSECI